MKSKALIIGALPEPFEGPWIPIQEADSWKLAPGVSLDAVIIETCEGFHQGEPKDLSVIENGEEFSGKFARALVTEQAEDLSVEAISVEIEVAA